MSVELIPKKNGQHVVTFVPKVTTDLPFFNLTYRKKDITNQIKFNSVDAAGNPIHWEVRHNTDDDIGYAGVQAHEVWYLLIKPAIDASRKENGKIAKIIPLGGIRECLRMVGWTQGGHQAKDFIKALTQISFAGIIADLWFPTGEFDDDGKPKFKQLKGRFSRMSVYAIGEQHLTQDELKNSDLSFELEDTVYIKLDDFEVMLQEAQADKQKLIDNQYMFSVKPIARRWYELMAGKIFGTLSYNKKFFEVKYSWYIERHHNLTKFHQLGKVTKQMNQVVSDHIKSGFLTKIECQKFKQPDRELDFIIRFYVGQTAQESINRIKGYILNKNRKGDIEVKRAAKTTQLSENSQKRSITPKQKKNAGSVRNLALQEESESKGDIKFLDTVTDDHKELLKTLVVEYQISVKKALVLVKEKKEECQRQIEAFPYRELEIKNKAGYFIKAIENSYSLPENFLEQKEKQIEKQKHQEKRTIIESCNFCNTEGYRFVKSDNYPTGAFKPCSHNEEIESKLEEYER